MEIYSHTKSYIHMYIYILIIYTPFHFTQILPYIKQFAASILLRGMSNIANFVAFSSKIDVMLSIDEQMY